MNKLSVILALILFGLKSKLHSVALPTPSFDPPQICVDKVGAIFLFLPSCVSYLSSSGKDRVQSNSWHRNHWAHGSTSSPSHAGSQCGAGEHSSSPPCFCGDNDKQSWYQSQNSLYQIRHIHSVYYGCKL